MKTNLVLVYLCTGAAFIVLGDGVSNGFAATPAPLQTAVEQSSPGLFQNVRWEAGKIEKLRHAYYLLDHADGDYHGHREAAMHSIKKAADLLGFEIKGGGHAEESQWKSDRKLHEARQLLADLQDETGGREQVHVHSAVKELDKALRTK
jgi:hypothetical protein